MIRVVKSSPSGSVSVTFKSLDAAMKRAALVHQDGKGYTTTAYKDDLVIAELKSNGDPIVNVYRYIFVPIPTYNWKVKPTTYRVYKMM